MRPIPPHLSTVTLQPYADPSIKTMGSGKGQPRNTSPWYPEIEPRSFRSELANSGWSMTKEELSVSAEFTDR